MNLLLMRQLRSSPLTVDCRGRDRWWTFAIATCGGDIIVKRDDYTIRSFALAHPHAARRILSVPTFLPSCRDDEDNDGNNNPILDGESLKTYLHWRKWNVMTILHNYPNLRNSHDAYTSAIGLLSHPLTFPLTLGWYFAAGRSRWNEVGGTNKQQ